MRLLVFNVCRLTPVFVYFVTMDFTSPAIILVLAVLHTVVLALVLLTA